MLKNIKTGILEGHEDDFGDDDEREGHWQTLCAEIRKLFSFGGFEIDVESSGSDIIVYVFLDDDEKIKNLLSLFIIVVRLEKDLLTGYVANSELYENKQGFPIMCFTFYGAEVWKDEDRWGDEDPDLKEGEYPW